MTWLVVTFRGFCDLGIWPDTIIEQILFWHIYNLESHNRKIFCVMSPPSLLTIVFHALSQVTLPMKTDECNKEKQLVWVATTRRWNPGHRTEVSYGINVPAREVHVEWGWPCNTNLQLTMCVLRTNLPGSITQVQHRLYLPREVSSGGAVAVLCRRQPRTGPKSGETLHTVCHIFTRNNPRATAAIQVCDFKVPYFMDPACWRPCLCSLMLNL